jgi:hypothetical protein
MEKTMIKLYVAVIASLAMFALPISANPCEPPDDGPISRNYDAFNPDWEWNCKWAGNGCVVCASSDPGSG